MLDVLGLDLITYMQDDTELGESEDSHSEVKVPNGIYKMSRKLKRWNNKIVKGQMQVADGKYILLKGCDVCPNEGKGLFDAVRVKRDSANIVDNILQEDIVFSSPTGPAVFILGSSANGWTSWKNEEGKPIDIFRS